ncbi:MAG TPA: sulfite exporter TauE/SafE family protein [Kiloniellales bacterium]|nr:sulfite exporter TauE/SafE family protein [Kiloniellales bacterium]
MLEAYSPETLLVAALAILLGGLVKGVLGLGLPLISVPLLALVMPVPAAVAVMAFPVLISNLVQIRQGTAPFAAFVRFWPLLATLIVGILLGAQLLAELDEQRLSLILGGLVIAFSLLNLASPRLELAPHHERLASPLVGFGAGLLGGFSSLYGPPLAMYLVALKLDKDRFVSAIAMAYATGSVPLYLSLAVLGILGPDEALISLGAIVPVLLGVQIGQRLRRRLPQRTFHVMILVMLLLIGINMIRRGLAIGF